jgi:type II secretory pathway component PulC
VFIWFNLTIGKQQSQPSDKTLTSVFLDVQTKKEKEMKKSFEDKRRKPVKPSRVVTMAEFVNTIIVRVILAKKEERVFESIQHV